MKIGNYIVHRLSIKSSRRSSLSRWDIANSTSFFLLLLNCYVFRKKNLPFRSSSLPKAPKIEPSLRKHLPEIPKSRMHLAILIQGNSSLWSSEVENIWSRLIEPFSVPRFFRLRLTSSLPLLCSRFNLLKLAYPYLNFYISTSSTSIGSSVEDASSSDFSDS